MMLLAYINCVLLLATSVCPLPNLIGSLSQQILNEIGDKTIKEAVDDVSNLVNQVNQQGIESILPQKTEDIINPLEDLLNNIDPNLNSTIQDLTQNLQNFLSSDPNQQLLLLQNLANLSISEQDLIRIVNSLFNSNASSLSDLMTLAENSSFIQSLLNDQSSLTLLNSFLTDPSSVTLQDIVTLIFKFMYPYNLTETQRLHLQKFIPELIVKLTQVQSLSDVYTILEPIIFFHLEYYMNNSAWSKNLTQNSLIDQFLHTNTLTLVDLMQILQPFASNLIPDKFIRETIFLHLPSVIQRLTLANTTQEYLDIGLEFYLTIRPFFNLTTQVQLDKLLYVLEYAISSQMSLTQLLPILQPFISSYLPDEPLLKEFIFLQLPQIVEQILNNNLSGSLIADILENLITQVYKSPSFTQLLESLKQNITQSVLGLPLFEMVSIQNILYKISLNYSLTLSDFVNAYLDYMKQEPLSETLTHHLDVYLPDLIGKLSRSNSTDQVLELFQQLIMTHFDYYLNTTDILTILLENVKNITYVNQFLQLESVQTVLFKFYLNGFEALMLSDFVYIYLDYMKLPPLSDVQKQHLDIYLPDLLNKLQSSSDLYSVLEPIISYHLNYYLNVNPSILENLINSYLNDIPFVQSLLGFVNTINRNSTQYKHLFEYVPEFVLSLFAMNSTDDMVIKIKLMAIYHINMGVESGVLLDYLDNLYSNLTMSLFNLTFGPIFETPDFLNLYVEFLKSYLYTYDLLESFYSVSNLTQDFLLKQSIGPLKGLIRMLSPKIYEFAYDQSDHKIVLAYAVHAGEQALHEQLRVMGIPYDNVFLGTTPTTTRRTTTTRPIEIDIAEIINMGNANKFDINKFLGDSGSKNDLKPFNFNSNNGNTDGPEDYY